MLDPSYMVVDIETYDPLLKDMGPGVYRKDGYILGVAVYQKSSGLKEYFNLQHKGISMEERAISMRRLTLLLDTPCTKVGANFIYDLDWLVNSLGLTVSGPVQDVQSRECLIDAYANSYSLDVLSLKYGSSGKHDEELIAYCKERGWGDAPQSHLWRIPFPIAERYALGDVEETGLVYEKQEPIIVAEGLQPILDIEMGLVPALIKMKKIGVRINESRRQEVADTLTAEYYAGMKDFISKYGECNINSGTDLGKIFRSLDIPIIQTANGNDSFKAEVLGLVDHPIGHEVLTLRSYKTVINNYINGSLLDYQINGRIHANFYPMRKDDGGTVTGRFACVKPNLQQIPAKEEKHGDLIRSCFEAEEDCWYGAPDYSQIEYRLLVHFATGAGSEEIRSEFNKNPKTDYHKYVQSMTGLDRKHAKNFNFGTVYCMGKKTMRMKFGFSVEECDRLTEQYYGAMPFIKPTRDAIINTVKKRGYVRTILGRRARVSKEMRDKDKYYVMVNYLIQGSAADVMKKGMFNAYNAGIFDYLPLHLTVHDELGVSVPKTKVGVEAYKELIEIMENCIHLDIPLRVDGDLGTNWGALEEHTDLDATLKTIEAGYPKVQTK